MQSRISSWAKVSTVVLSMLTVDALATGVQVDNGHVLTSDLIASIVIENDIIKITSINLATDPWNIVQAPGNVSSPVVNLTVNGSGVASVPLDTEVVVHWEVFNSTGCNTTGGTTAWQALDITPVDGTSTGDFAHTVTTVNQIRFTLTCDDDDVGTDPGVGFVDISGFEDFPPPTANLSVGSEQNEITVARDAMFTIHWEATESTSCVPSNGDADWLAANFSLTNGAGNGDVPLTASFSADTTYTLTCTGQGAPAAVPDFNVRILSEACPANWDPSLSGTSRTWLQIIGLNWPGPRYVQNDIGVPRAGYLAIEFTTDDKLRDGGFSSIPHSTTYGDRLGAISRCPGDFSQHLPNDDVVNCAEIMSLNDIVRWSTDTSPATNECVLEPGTTYYFNITFALDGENASSDECVSSRTCQTILETFH